ncbi:MAG: SurA N-terminal domain-containing protein, partial [candidate division Zixibacteria bacterium]|nr:SurA N-terminal domain-containing protein [candidate division Zixibacteria bacterium]
MKRMICGPLFAVLVLVAVGTATAQRDVVDKIAVVVGDRVILSSELTAQVQLYAFQGGRQVNTEDELRELENEVLQQMITEQLFLIEARQDTSITIRPEEIEQALDEHITRIAGNFDSEQAFLDALAAEGLNVRELRKKYRTDVENQLLRQRFIQRKLYSVSVSRREVEGFYEKFKDSIPAQPEGVKLAHILKAFAPSPAVEDSIKNRALELRQMILDGADFATLAVQYSSMG